MRLLIIRLGRWKVLAPLVSHETENTNSECCPLSDQLRLFHSGNYRASVAGLVKLIEICAEKGPRGLSDSLFHLADRTEKIYEFIKGDLRLFCFVGDGAVVVCSTAAIKKKRTSDKQEVSRAVRLKEAYFLAKSSNKIEEITGDDDELRGVF